jgi:hypothetical protein
MSLDSEITIVQQNNEGLGMGKVAAQSKDLKHHHQTWLVFNSVPRLVP